MVVSKKCEIGDTEGGGKLFMFFYFPFPFHFQSLFHGNPQLVGWWAGGQGLIDKRIFSLVGWIVDWV